MFSSQLSTKTQPTSGGLFGSTTNATTANATSSGAAINLNKNDIVVPSPPEDTVSSLAFAPQIPGNNNFYLCSSAWDGSASIWEITTQGGGQVLPKLQQKLQAPLLDVAWSGDGSKVFVAGGDNKGWMWDIASNQMTQIAQHDSAIKTINFIDAPNYKCVMTGSLDKRLRFWDLRSPSPILEFTLSDRIYCADVQYPLAVVATADRQVVIFKLIDTPAKFTEHESALKNQSRAVSIFNNKQKKDPAGYALGCCDGRVAIQYINPTTKESNFTFKCHRHAPNTGNTLQDIYAVNAICCHPQYGTIATTGSDGRYIFWDKDVQTRLFISEFVNQPITACSIDPQGQIFAYAAGYDWSKGHEYNDSQKKPSIYLKPCAFDMNPDNKKK